MNGHENGAHRGPARKKKEARAVKRVGLVALAEPAPSVKKLSHDDLKDVLRAKIGALTDVLNMLEEL